MSQPSAIAAVAATLRNLLTLGVTPDQDLNDTTVTTMPPDRARAVGNNANQLNIFLYQAMPNAAWRNLDMPGRANPGEIAMPPLALTLHFLLTAYGRDNDLVQPFSLQLLGSAMCCCTIEPFCWLTTLRTPCQAMTCMPRWNTCGSHYSLYRLKKSTDFGLAFKRPIGRRLRMRRRLFSSIVSEA